MHIRAFFFSVLTLVSSLILTGSFFRPAFWVGCLLLLPCPFFWPVEAFYWPMAPLCWPVTCFLAGKGLLLADYLFLLANEPFVGRLSLLLAVGPPLLACDLFAGW